MLYHLLSWHSHEIDKDSGSFNHEHISLTNYQYSVVGFLLSKAEWDTIIGKINRCKSEILNDMSVVEGRDGKV